MAVTNRVQIDAYSVPMRIGLHGRRLLERLMLRSMDSPPAVGYQVIAVWCNCCGHKANVAPDLWHRTTKRHCRMCGSRDYTHRIIWIGGPKPDNVVPFAKRRI